MTTSKVTKKERCCLDGVASLSFNCVKLGFLMTQKPYAENVQKAQGLCIVADEQLMTAREFPESRERVDLDRLFVVCCFHMERGNGNVIKFLDR